jgi:hypothetical protein
VAYARLQALLMENHLDFHFADTRCWSARWKGVLCVRDLRISIIVPPMQVTEPPLRTGWSDGKGRWSRHLPAFEPDVLQRIREPSSPV